LEDGVIFICQSQKYHEKKKEYYISDTKNGKVREIPITDKIADVLIRIKAIQNSYGITDDYVFSTADDAANKKKISDYMQNKRVQYKIKQPVSIHAQRRTLNSKLENNGVSTTVRTSILGHNPRTNNQNYSYDRSSLLYIKEKFLHWRRQCDINALGSFVDVCGQINLIRKRI